MSKANLHQSAAPNCIDLIPALREAVQFAAVVTDPPYGIGWRRGVNPARASKAHAGIVNDEDTTARDVMLELVQDLPAAVFGSFYAPQPPRLKQVLTWRKPPDAGVVGSTTGYRRDVEPVFLVGPWPIRTVEWSSLLVSEGSIAHITTATGHPHTKPVPLMRDLIRRCPPGPILDPFCGSGSTLVAAKQLGRRVVGSTRRTSAACLSAWRKARLISKGWRHDSGTFQQFHLSNRGPMTFPIERFTVTDEHLKLARCLEVGYDEDTEFGAPEIDPKRPYGNSDVLTDMREILGREMPDKDDGWNTGADEQYLLILHKEMATVLQIGLRTGSFKAGEYQARKYFGDWKAVESDA